MISIDAELDIESELTNENKNHARSAHPRCNPTSKFTPGTILESNCGALYRVKGIETAISDKVACPDCVNNIWTKLCPVCNMPFKNSF